MAYNAVNVNNDGMVMFGEGALLRSEFWNGALSLKMFPSTGMTTEGKVTYDFKKRIQITLPIDSVLMLARKIEENIIPAINEKRDAEIGIISAKVNMIHVAVKDEKIYISIFNDIGESKKPGKMLTMMLREHTIFNHYDPEDGTFEVETVKDATICTFTEFLKSCVLTLGAVTHGIDYHHAKRDESEISFRNAVANKLGINFDQPVNYISRSVVDPWATPVPPSGGKPSSTPTVAKPGDIDDITGLL